MSLNLEGAHGLNHVVAQGNTAGAALTGLSGAASTYSTSAVGYTINGQSYGKAAVAGGATPTTDANTAVAATLSPSFACAVAWGLDSAGTVKLYKGTPVAWDGVTTGLALPLPSVPSSIAVFALHSLKATSAASVFTIGSSNWNATGITVGTVVNCAGMFPPAGITT